MNDMFVTPTLEIHFRWPLKNWCVSFVPYETCGGDGYRKVTHWMLYLGPLQITRYHWIGKS